MKSSMMLSESKNGLYVLQHDQSPASSFSRSCNWIFNSIFHSKNSTSTALSSVSHPDVINRLGHDRLGHIPLSNMKNINEIPVFVLSKFTVPCDICLVAKQSKLPFSSIRIASVQIFDLIHIDIWGPFHTPTYNGYKYFLAIVDDYSRGTWVFLLSTKSNAFPTLRNFLAMVERQFDKRVKIIRSYNVMELGSSQESSSLFLSKGIIHQTSCIAKSQQNGVVERRHMHLLEMARSLLFQSHLPSKF